jgi:DNA mismatch endonuclease, patch repair protein
MVHRMGHRFRLHVRTLPGNPDIVLPRHKKILLVHGCFWHGHKRCLKGRPPKSNLDFWIPKLAANRMRDRVVVAKLRRLGWKVLVIWQCQLRRPETLRATLQTFLGR